MKAKEENSKRILMLTQYIGLGGLERMILSLSRGLLAFGKYEPFAFAYDYHSGTVYQNLVQDFRNEKIPLEVMRKPKGFSPLVVYNLIRFVLRNKIRVIHSHNIGSLIYGSFVKVLLFGRVQLLHTQHSFIHLKEKRRYAIYERIFGRVADRITVVSQDTKDTYKTLGYSEGCVQVVENGVGFLSEPVLTLEQRSRAREEAIAQLEGVGAAHTQELMEYKEDFWLLYLARLHPEKGQDYALKVWNEIAAQKRKQMVLLFVGPESGKGQLHKLERGISVAPEKPRVLYLGGSRNPQSWIKASDLFLFCSEFEGLPLGALEAVGSGLPAVLSNIPGHQCFEGVSQLFDLNVPHKGALAVERIYQKLKDDFSETRKFYWENTRWIQERYSIESMVKQYSRLYDELF